MIGRLLRACLIQILLLASSLACADTPRAWAYQAWWMPDSWRTAPIDRLERLLFFELKVSPSGAIGQRHGWPEQWQELRATLRQKNVPLDLTLTLFGVKAFEALFSSPRATQRLLEEAYDLATHVDVAGLQLDVEVYDPVRPATLAAYRRFLQALAHKLHHLQPQRQLSVFFPLGGASTLYDAPSLAVTDRVVMQAYDAHWTGSGQAGPVAPLTGQEAVTWEKGLAAARALGVPPHRVAMSFPLYGYEWRVEGPTLRAATKRQGTTTTFAPVPAAHLPDIRVNIQDRVLQHGAQHDKDSGSSYYQFRNAEGHYVEGWFEDWWSLKRKAEFIRREGLAGMAFFILGYDSNALVDYYLNGTP
ncbi:glycosyl hydrolase family 18 protein [Noviherbaspirillum malthae]|uniref:glycosyl hydrolase family 18 protein n=1 Tax=Noviherbaspirillum malthae TaxID=1260987 RepID=UPI00188EF0B8|nr:glycosyl hydrolase family 18 protein [Noviherbaspirillum malthae]